MTTTPIGSVVVNPLTLADPTALVFPETGDCIYNISMTEAATPTIVGQSIGQTMDLYIEPNGFEFTLPDNVIGSDIVLPVDATLTIHLTIKSQNGTLYLESADSYVTGAVVVTPPVVTGPQPTGGTFMVNANLSGLGDGSGNIPGIPGTSYPILAASEYTYLASKGIKQLRMPGLWLRLQPDYGNNWQIGQAFPELNTAYLGLYQSALANAYAAGLGVVVEPLHNYGRLDINYNTGPTNTSTVLELTPVTANFAVTKSSIAVSLINSPSTSVVWQYRPTGTTAWLTPTTILAGQTLPGVTPSGVTSWIFYNLAEATTYDVQAVGIGELDGITTAQTQTMGDGVLTIAMFVDTWVKIATALKGTPGLAGYDLMNEPHDFVGAGETWRQYAQAAITGIRTVDTVTTIYVEGYGYASASAWPQYNPTLHLLTDPSNNIIFSAHMYLDSNASGTNFIWASVVAEGDLLQVPTGVITEMTGYNRLVPAITWANLYGFKLSIGECGVGNDDPAWNRALTNVLNLCQTCEISFFYFTAGPYYKNYAMGIEPTGTIDTRQMAVLSTFAGVTDAPVACLFSGPRRGAVSVASTDFTVDIRGIIPNAGTVMYSDNGGGGTFIPASLAVAAGENFLGAFEYVPSATAKTVTISVTNSLGLTNPASLGYSTITDIFVTLGTDATNAVWPLLYDTTHVRPAVTLYLKSTGLTQDFYYINGQVDQAGILAWAGTETPYVVTNYDQGPSQHDLGIIDGDNKAAVGGVNAVLNTPANYPAYILNAYGGQPTMRFATSKMDAVSPINALGGLTVIFAANMTTTGNGRCMISWDFTQSLQLCDSNGNYALSTDTTTTQSAGLQPGTMHIYAMVYDGNDSLRYAYCDGVLLSTQAASELVLLFQYRSNLNAGYFRYSYLPVNFDLSGFFIIDRSMTSAEVIPFMQQMMSDLNVLFPIAVTALSVGATTATTQVISWVNPSNPLAGTTYNINYRIASTSSWTIGASGISGETGTVQALASNTSYEYEVVSVYSGYMTASATTVIAKTTANTSGTGRTIQRLGTNVGGLEISGGALATKDALIQYFGQGAGITTYRLNTLWYNFAPTLGQAALDSTYLAKVKQTVQSMLNYGATTIIIDLHDYCTYNNHPFTLPWTASTLFPIGSTVQATTASGSVNIYTVTTAGTSGASAPSWPASGTVSDGSIVWAFQTRTPSTTYAKGNTVQGTTAAGVTNIYITYATSATTGTAASIVWPDSGSVLDGGVTWSYLVPNVGHPTPSQFGDIWVLIMSDPMFKNNPIFMCGLNNEPHIGSTVWYQFVNAAKAKLRAAGITNQITVAPSSGGSMSSIGEVITQGLTDTQPITAEGHQYWDSSSSGSNVVVNAYDYPISAAMAIGQFLAANSVLNIFYGEVGFDKYGTAALAFDAFLSVCQRAGVDIITLWGGGQEFGPAYIYDDNQDNIPGIMAILQNYLPGGSKYGVPALALAAGLYVAVGNAATFGGVGAYGGTSVALASGFMDIGGKYSPNRNVTYPTIEAFFKYTTTPVGNAYIIGDYTWMCVQTTATGAFEFTYGNGNSRVIFTTPKTYNDGNYHHVAISAGPTGVKYFIDGALVGSNATLYASTGAANNVVTSIGGWSNRSVSALPGLVSEAVMWATNKYPAAFTPRKQPISVLVDTVVGVTDGMTMYAPLNGNLNTFV